MSAPKVIIFGPTGAVGSSAALTASTLGSPVTLAMRDTSKPIPGLSAETESAQPHAFTRLHADLSQPASVQAACTASGATHAFIYLCHPAPDGMLATIEALKAGGIRFVVLLSSFTVQADTPEALRAIPRSEMIPWLHAQVEISLWEIFGPGGFVAVRPGSFASNTFAHARGMGEGVVRVLVPGSRSDCIVQEDIGRVAGRVLVEGRALDGASYVDVLGPEAMSQEELVRRIARALGREVGVEAATEAETRRVMVEVLKRPAELVDYMVGQSSKAADTSAPVGKVNVFGYHVDEGALGSVERYTGTKGMTVEEWVEKSRGKWEQLIKQT